MNNVNGEMRSVRIIYYKQTELPRRCSERNNGDIWFICFVYYKETDLPRRCSERHKARFGPSVSIYSPLPLFGNEQRRNLGVCIYKLSFNLTYFSFNTLVSSHIFFVYSEIFAYCVCVCMYVCTPSWHCLGQKFENKNLRIVFQLRHWRNFPMSCDTSKRKTKSTPLPRTDRDCKTDWVRVPVVPGRKEWRLPHTYVCRQSEIILISESSLAVEKVNFICFSG